MNPYKKTKAVKSSNELANVLFLRNDRKIRDAKIREKREELDRIRQEKRTQARAEQEARNAAVLQLLNSDSYISSTCFKPTTPKYMYSKDSRLAEVESDWITCGIELAAMIRKMSKAKRELLDHYKAGNAINVNMALDLDKLEKYYPELF